MSEWQPIETAPRDGTEVLIYCPPGEHYEGMYTAAYDTLMGGCWTDNARRTLWPLPATHWMPLPSPPRQS